MLRLRPGRPSRGVEILSGGRFALGHFFGGPGRCDTKHEIGQVGGKLPATMPWIGAYKLVDKEKNWRLVRPRPLAPLPLRERPAREAWRVRGLAAVAAE